MSTEANKAVLRRLLEAYNTRKMSVLEQVVEECYSADLVWHDSGPEGRYSGIEGAKRIYREMNGPALEEHATIEDLIAEGDRVAVRYVVRGTWASTGKPFSLWDLRICRFVDGKIAEVWEAGAFTEGGTDG
jgi:ketosteroid isomerase-like protein